MENIISFTAFDERIGSIISHKRKSPFQEYSLMRVVIVFRHKGHEEMVTPQSLQV